MAVEIPYHYKDYVDPNHVYKFEFWDDVMYVYADNLDDAIGYAKENGSDNGRTKIFKVGIDEYGFEDDGEELWNNGIEKREEGW